MNIYNASTATICALLIGCASSGQSGGEVAKSGGDQVPENTIRLKDLGEPLVVVEGHELLDRVTGEIEYRQIGMDKYDSISMESARLYGLMMQLDHIYSLKDDESLPEGFDIAAIATFTAVAVPKAVDSTETLMQNAQALNPASDFTGLKARKAPAATALVAESIDRLKDAALKGKSLMDRI